MGSSNSKMHEEIMLVPKVAMRQPTAGPTASFMVSSLVATRPSAVPRSRADPPTSRRASRYVILSDAGSGVFSGSSPITSLKSSLDTALNTASVSLVLTLKRASSLGATLSWMGSKGRPSSSSSSSSSGSTSTTSASSIGSSSSSSSTSPVAVVAPISLACTSMLAASISLAPVCIDAALALWLMPAPSSSSPGRAAGPRLNLDRPAAPAPASAPDTPASSSLCAGAAAAGAASSSSSTMNEVSSSSPAACPEGPAPPSSSSSTMKSSMSWGSSSSPTVLRRGEGAASPPSDAWDASQSWKVWPVGLAGLWARCLCAGVTAPSAPPPLRGSAACDARMRAACAAVGVAALSGMSGPSVLCARRMRPKLMSTSSPMTWPCGMVTPLAASCRRSSSYWCARRRW
mmetsp:Transcript_20792/g.52854  ORF Transcript_20792/g.52854 Transcript_20792/m.52854 type:complete len:402 (-) Transcript_20792:532-1737(-)